MHLCKHSDPLPSPSARLQNLMGALEDAACSVTLDAYCIATQMQWCLCDSCRCLSLLDRGLISSGGAASLECLASLAILYKEAALRRHMVNNEHTKLK